MVDRCGRVRLTNPDKVLYPATGTTKAEVFEYYVTVADAMVPHVAGRPVTRKRWPNGVGQADFFEKQLASSAPEWLERASVTHRSGTTTYPRRVSSNIGGWRRLYTGAGRRKVEPASSAQCLSIHGFFRPRLARGAVAASLRSGLRSLPEPGNPVEDGRDHDRGAEGSRARSAKLTQNTRAPRKRCASRAGPGAPRLAAASASR